MNGRSGEAPGGAAAPGGPVAPAKAEQMPVHHAVIPGDSSNGRSLREGHSGVWRSDAGHEDAREERTVRSVPEQ
ncbi:hypothetical protein GCM10018787_22540 [Streptomyces thermodiastaticus]|nr:hypothetical protein GCM10018787_22540 [Streptomyces thermodiastaticus]